MENFQLTADEKNILESVYGRKISGGYNPRGFEAVKELNGREKKFFGGKVFASSNFFVQTLYKVRGTVSPLKFTIAVNKILGENENLRANFCNVGTRTVKVIRSAKDSKPEIIFRNLMHVEADDLDDELRKILEADMRRACDFRHDQLIRFAVYKTGDDEFAAIVTLAQVIAESFDAENFFAKVLGVPVETTCRRRIKTQSATTGKKFWTKLRRPTLFLMSGKVSACIVKKFSARKFPPTFCPTCAPVLNRTASCSRRFCRARGVSCCNLQTSGAIVSSAKFFRPTIRRST